MSSGARVHAVLLVKASVLPARVMGEQPRFGTSHSERWRSRARAAGRRRDRQLFPPHISVQRHHQSLAEMSVLQAGDRPLNVSPSQVNTESQPASHRQREREGGGGETQGVDEDKKRKHGDSD